MGIVHIRTGRLVFHLDEGHTDRTGYPESLLTLRRTVATVIDWRSWRHHTRRRLNLRLRRSRRRRAVQVYHAGTDRVPGTGNGRRTWRRGSLLTAARRRNV